MLLLGQMNKAWVRPHLSVFVLLGLLVIFSQVTLLKPIVGQGLTNEDYVGFFKVRLYKDQMFSDPIRTWKTIGIHDATHDFYIGFLNRLFGENYALYLYFNILIKIVATLLLYVLILVISKNKLLAFLGSFLYGISYPSTGALYLYVVGNEYLGVALMNLFLITYYFSVKKASYILILLSSIVVTLAYFASPTRIFPVFIIVLLVETYMLIEARFRKLILPILRIIATFLPVILITLSGLGSLGGDAYSPAGWPDFLKKITNGNWYFLLNPLWGLGYTFLPAAYLRILTTVDISTLFTYLQSFLLGPQIKLGVVALLVSFLIAIKPLRFFLILMFINLLFNIAIFFLYTHHFTIPQDLVIPYAGPSFSAGLYSGILAAFVFSISISCLIEWLLTQKKERLLMITFFTPFLSLFFILGQWFFTRDYYMYQEGIHRYFVIPAIFSYLFIASLLVLITKKFNKRYILLKVIFISFILLQIFNISYTEINQLFTGKKGSGKDLKLQQLMQNQTVGYIPKDNIKDDIFVYIKFKSPKLGDANQWEDTFDWRNFTFWMPIKKSYITNKSIDGCIAITWDFAELVKMIKVQDGIKGFLYNRDGNKEMNCFRDGKGYTLDGKFVKLDNFYAFSVQESKVINITEEVKKSLFNNI